ncbi:SGNH/GDSL hydrolase family protein [Nucisporomicrobium flavum]|uniref:SGNH/GDSL hydrolase family protein n=1 Tax=Nucisporomicrobium flavum TaxID=2785915 RepID=UPI0018F56F46|nr:GDSL-type esterase/lipase family protein [Nucisporomicrobium flavum]
MTVERPFTDAERRHFLRYTRTRSWPMLQRYPVGDDLHAELLARMLSTSPESISTLIRSLRDEAEAAAARLLTGSDYRDALAALPFRPDDRIVAVGDSITADRLGWFDVLAASFALAGAPAPTLVNLGVSGDTTADVLERFDLVQASRPSRVLLMLGTNDARAHGPGGGHRMATIHETERNLRALVQLVTRDLRTPITVLTPSVVDQDRIDGYFRDGPVRWDATAVAEVAGIVRKVVPDAVDLYGATQTAGADVLEEDGVHPSPAGQQLILRRVLHHLGADR